MAAKRDENKCKRKKLKYFRVAKEEYGVEPSDEATQYVMVCNVGHSMGISREEILARFGEHWRVCEVHLLEKKSHSFVVFDSASEASRCLETVNGLVQFPGVTGPILFIYLKTKPDCVSAVEGRSGVWELPPGAILIENFVTEEEENTLSSKIVQGSTCETHLKQRRAVHFGYEFVYGKNNVDVDCPLTTPLPPECDFVRERLALKGYQLDWCPDQLTVNEYHPGHGIPPHVDTHSVFEDPILSLSLNSDTVMEFTLGHRILNIVLPRRSILIMSGESRYRWIHGISARKTDVVLQNGRYVIKKRGLRVSYTFRKVRRQPRCECPWPEMCDSRKSDQTESPSFFEEKYVHSVYDQIFDHFSTTRHKPWPKVLEFVQSLTPSSVLIDVGCGNGKYFGFSKCFEIGCDYNAGLIEITNDRGFEALRVNCLQLPFMDNTADAVISIAVLHHLSTRARRLRALEEILRVLRPTGKALVYVWAKEQDNSSVSYLKSGRETTATSSGSSRETDLSQRDLLVPWKKKDESTFMRYYHVFESGELTELCVETGARVLNSYYDRGNWCVVFCK